MNNTYKFVKFIIKIITRFLYPYKIVNKENLNIKGPFIIIMNHKSQLDPLYIIDFNQRHIHFFAKKELKKWPLINYFFNRVELIYVDRKIKNNGTTKKGEAYLKKGELIALFPEGTRNKSQNPILPFKYGAFSMAQKENAFIVPIIMHGKKKLFQKKLLYEVLKPRKITKNLDEEVKIFENLYSSKLKNEYKL